MVQVNFGSCKEYDVNNRFFSKELAAKQPKRGVVAGEKGFIEISDYPRAQRAVITYTEDGRKEVIEAGSTDAALQYEVRTCRSIS